MRDGLWTGPKGDFSLCCSLNNIRSMYQCKSTQCLTNRNLLITFSFFSGSVGERDHFLSLYYDRWWGSLSMQNLAVLGIAINADMYNKLKVSMYGRLPYKHANCLWYENDNCHRVDLTSLMAVRV